MSKYSRRRNRLLSRGRVCFWCGVEVVYIHAEEWPKGTMPANFATVDHLYDRLTYPDRQAADAIRGERTVLACFACNQRRNQERHQALAKRQEKGRATRLPEAREAPEEAADG